MRKLTVSVPDEVYRRLQVRAEQQGRSVNALVTEYLATLAGEQDEFERLLAQQEEVGAEIEDFRAGDRLERDEVHERARS